LPTCPVAMISRSGCIARHTMSSVCVVKNCCVCSALSYAIPVAPCVRWRMRRAKKDRESSFWVPFFLTTTDEGGEATDGGEVARRRVRRGHRARHAPLDTR
jgi:hypothetical protein